MSAADGIVLSTPQIPKTLGILNIIFGVLLVLVGSCMVAGFFVAPMIQQYSLQFQAQIKQQTEARRQAQLKSLEDQEKAATTEQEKATLKADRDALAATPVPTPPAPDLQALDQFKNPTIRAYTMVYQGTGLVWDLALIVSGIGLVRLRGWGRSLAGWLAGIQIVRLILLTAASLIFVAPIQKQITDRTIADVEARVKAGTANQTEANMLPLTKASAQLAPVYTLAFCLIGVIYPGISLWLLNTAGTRAACSPGKPEGVSDLPGAP